MNYEKRIIDVLYSSGKEGLSVKAISRYVYNSENSFFAPLDYTAVYKWVSSYLIRSSHKPGSVIKKSSSRGIYYIDYKSDVWKQMQLQFDKVEPKDSSSLPDEDTSLSLF